MSSFELLSLVASHLIVACMVGVLCRRRSGIRLKSEKDRRRLMELESQGVLEQLHGVRAQFRALESQLIHIQLVMEQTQERLEASSVSSGNRR